LAQEHIFSSQSLWLQPCAYFTVQNVEQGDILPAVLACHEGMLSNEPISGRDLVDWLHVLGIDWHPYRSEQLEHRRGRNRTLAYRSSGTRERPRNQFAAGARLEAQPTGAGC
jgi:hypothetical protein